MSSKKYKVPSDVWNNHSSKLVVQVVEAEGLKDASFTPYCKVSVGDKVIGKTKKIKETAAPKWGDIFFYADMDDAKYLSVEVFSDKHFLGEATLSQLQTLQPFDEVIDKWWDLQPKYLMKDKEKERVGGRVHLKLYYSMLPESRPVTTHVMDSAEIYLTKYFASYIKTGDLILYDGVGLLPALTKIERNAPFSHVGLVVVLPSKWSGKDDVYVLEASRNVDNFRDAFTLNADTGVVLWPLKERIHQFYGPSVWWAPSQKAVHHDNHEALVRWLTPVMNAHKNLKCKKNGTFEPPFPAGMTPLTLLQPIVDSAVDIFGLPRKWTNFIETASCDLVLKALAVLGLVDAGTAQTPQMWPDQLLDLPIFGDPFPLRQKAHSFHIDALPPLIQKDFIQHESRHLSQEQRSEYNKKQEAMLATGGSIRKLTALGANASPGPGRDKMLRARETVLAFDMGDRNLTHIMLKGARLMRFTHELKAKNLNLSPNEDEIVCGHHHIDIQDVDEIRLGLKSTNFDRYRKDLEKFEPLAFSIMYGRRRKRIDISKSLDFIANTPLEYKIWTVGLQQVLDKRDNPEISIVQKAFRELKVPRLNLADTVKLLEKINFKAPTKFVAEKFHEVDVDKSHYLDFNEFVQLLRALKHRPSITDLFQQYAQSNAQGDSHVLIDKDELALFLKQEQGVEEGRVSALADAILQKYSTHGGQLDHLDFEAYMLSAENELFDTVEGRSVLSTPVAPMPMDRPLSHYFMASSHNTYLVGNQLTGQSSTEQYILVLRNGCRCVELDAWDGEDGNPVIYHGHTLTSKITFENAINAINNYAFYISSYPVALSIENHCSHDQQVRMGQIMQKVFGDRLLLPCDRTKGDCLGWLASPEHLREKIIVKGPMNGTVDKKYPKHEFDAQGNPIVALDASLTENYDSDEEEADSRPLAEVGDGSLSLSNSTTLARSSNGGSSTALQRPGSTALNRSGTPPPPSDGSAASTSTPSAPGTPSTPQRAASTAHADLLGAINAHDSGLITTAITKSKVKKPKVSDMLSECITLRTVHFKDFATNSKQQPWEMSSFAELTAVKYATSSMKECINYNIAHLSRVYPKGIRFNSSNYDPYPGFSLGSQMVALNWQTQSPPMYYVEAFFARNFRSGYILKPPHLLDPTGQAITPNLYSELKVRVIDARQLPKKHESQVGRPRIEVGVFGCKADTLSFHTSTADNGYNPSWNETFTFPITESWSACLVFRLWDRDDDENDVAHYSAMLESLQPGYRMVPLFQTGFHRVPMANILVQITRTSTGQQPAMAAAPSNLIRNPSKTKSRALARDSARDSPSPTPLSTSTSSAGSSSNP